MFSIYRDEADDWSLTLVFTAHENRGEEACDDTRIWGREDMGGLIMKGHGRDYRFGIKIWVLTG